MSESVDIVLKSSMNNKKTCLTAGTFCRIDFSVCAARERPPFSVCFYRFTSDQFSAYQRQGRIHINGGL